MSNPNRRRRLVVDRELQSRIIFAVSWPPAVCLALTAVLMGVYCARIAEQANAADVQLDVVPLFLTAMGFLIVATFFFLLNSLRMSHRIAGPIYRLSTTLKQVRQGDVTVRSHLRDGDLLTELADEMNEFLDWASDHLPKNNSLVESSEPADVELEATDAPLAEDVKTAPTPAAETVGAAASDRPTSSQ